ncbi:MAG: single-stranded DNA-binding protein [Patescibacteria group bacterium]
MRSFNKVMLYGNLTSDPEVRPTKTGTSFTTFSIATNRDWKNKEGAVVSETDFHKVVAFGKLGEIVGEYLKKGRPVLVCGRLTNRSYTNKEGIKRYVTEVVLDDFNFLSSGRKKAEKKETQEAEVEVAA